MIKDFIECLPQYEQLKQMINNKYQYPLISIIIPVYNIDDLKKTIDDYDEIAKTKSHGESSNNKRFNEQLEQIVDGLF